MVQHPGHNPAQRNDHARDPAEKNSCEQNGHQWWHVTPGTRALVEDSAYFRGRGNPMGRRASFYSWHPKRDSRAFYSEHEGGLADIRIYYQTIQFPLVVFIHQKKPRRAGYRGSSDLPGNSHIKDGTIFLDDLISYLDLFYAITVRTSRCKFTIHFGRV